MRFKKIITLAVLLILLCIVITSSYAIESNLLYEIHFENGLTDSSGSIRSTLYGGATISENGRDSNYVSLKKATGSYIGLDSKILSDVDEISIMMWVRLSDSPSNYSRIMDFGYVDNGVKQFVSLHYYESKLSLSISTNFPSQNRMILSKNIPISGWNHVSLTYSKSGEVIVYINSEVALKTTISQKLEDISFNSCTFGSSLFAGDPFIDMDLDDIKIFNNVLSKEEIEVKSGINVEDAIKKDLDSITITPIVKALKINLPTNGNNGTILTWRSSNQSVISNDGFVSRSDSQTEAIEVTLTVTATKADRSVTKEYVVSVMPVDVTTSFDNTISGNVTLLESKLTELRDLNKEYLFKLDTERLLVNYRITSNIKTNATEYGGWISRNVGAGNFLGHYISALSFLYNESKDKEVLDRLNYMIDALRECQIEFAKINPKNKGYFGAIDLTTLDQLEATGYCNWVPWYNIEKNISCLYDAYYYAGNKTAYDMLIEVCDWASTRINGLSQSELANTLNKEYGGIGYILLKTYLITKNKEYLKAGEKFLEKKLFDDIYNGLDPLSYKHSNTAIPKLLSSCYAYLATGDDYYLEVAKKGFDLIYNGRLYATGGTSQVEEWWPAHEVNNEGFMHQETCCSYNMLRLSDMLYKITGDKLYMDYYEHTFLNSILGSIDPVTGMKTYNVSMDSGYYKIYHTEFTSFWCCTGTGVENFTKLNQNIYYENESSLVINQYRSSVYDDGSIKLIQETKYPYEFTTKITIEKFNSKVLSLRNPSWSEDTIVKVVKSGNENTYKSSSDYIDIENLSSGDIVEVTFTPNFRLLRLDNYNIEKYAICYGPVLLSGIISDIGSVSPIQNNSMAGKLASDDVTDELFYSGEVFSNIERLNTLEFMIHGNNQSIYLKPFFDCHRESYIIYFNLFEENSPSFDSYIDSENNKNSIVLDSIDCGNWFSESLHNMNYFNSSIGNLATEHCRGIEEGGWVSYTMKVERGVENSLFIRHYGIDAGYTYDIYINDELIDSNTIYSHGQTFYELETKIPLKFTKTKDQITVKIFARSGRTVPGLYKLTTKRCGFEEISKVDLTFNDQSTQSFTLPDNTLIDRVRLDLSTPSEVKVMYSIDGFKYVEAFNGYLSESFEINKFAEVKKIRITSQNTNIKVTTYGGEIISNGSITGLIASDNDKYVPEEYVTVKVKDQGTVRLRVDYSNLDLSKEVHSKANIYNTNIKVNVDIEAKSFNDDLILYYDFDNDNEGYILNGNATKVNGKYGKALNLNGLSYLEVPKLKVENEITISMWVKFNSPKKLLYQHLFDFGNNKDNNLFLCPSAYGSGNTNGAKYVISDKVYEFDTSKWYLYTLVIKGGVATAYVDGIKLSTNTKFYYSVNNINSYQNLYIGKSNMEYVPLLNASIDEVRIYSYGMSDSQVKGLSQLNDINK